MVPHLAYLSKRRLDAGFVIDRGPFYVEAVFVQLVLLTIAIVVRFAAHLKFTVLQPLDGARLVIIVVGLLIAFAVVTIDWFLSDPGTRDRLLMLVPRTRGERMLWVAVAASAAIGEEIVYRGVLFNVVLPLIGDAWVTAGICAILFAAAHSMQGWKNAAIVAVFALGFHWLVMFTGGLMAGIVIHFVYDVATGWVAGNYAERNAAATPQD